MFVMSQFVNLLIINFFTFLYNIFVTSHIFLF